MAQLAAVLTRAGMQSLLLPADLPRLRYCLGMVQASRKLQLAQRLPPAGRLQPMQQRIHMLALHFPQPAWSLAAAQKRMH